MTLSNYLTSQEFLESLSPLKEVLKEDNDSRNVNIVEYMISNVIILAILMGEVDTDIDEKVMRKFIYQTSQKIKENLSFESSFNFTEEIDVEVRKYMIDALLEKKQMTREEAQVPGNKRKLYEEITKRLLVNGYCFHAFNSCYFDSIQKYGLDPTRKFDSQEELDEINKLFEKYQIGLIFGWQQINCKGKVSYSRTPSVSYYYGISSPEWFSQFTGAGFPFNPKEKYDKYAFPKGDYESARKNLETLMTEKGFTTSDQAKVISFFNKNWELYANRAPRLVMIPQQIITSERAQKIPESLMTDPLYHGKLEAAIELCTTIMGFGKDEREDQVISTNNAIFIELPSYQTIIQKLLKEEDKTINKDENQEKLTVLMNARIRIEKTPNNQTRWVSDNSEEELEQVKQILEDSSIYRAILSNPDNFHNLGGWLYYFSDAVKNEDENIKLLALNAPSLLGMISREKKEDIELMREVSSQPNISPTVLYYVGEEVQNDFSFIANIINNTNTLLFDFYMTSEEGESNLRYCDFIGKDVKENREFWSLLNDKIDTINETTSTHIPHFDIDKELSIARGEKGKHH